MRCLPLLLLIATTPIALAQANDPRAGGRCGEVLSIATQSGATMRYAYAEARGGATPRARSALVMLIGGGGVIALDDKGCPQKLNGNSLVR
jgi:hypothetical protein